MEGLLLLLLLVFYLLLRIAFGLRPDPSMRDRRRWAKGLELVRMRQYGEGCAYFRRATEVSPTSAVAHSALARCLYEGGDYLLALSHAQRAIHLDYYLPDAHLTMGKAMYKLGDTTAALLHLDKAVWLDRTGPEPLTWRALAYARHGQDDKARRDLEAAHRLGDENAGFYLRTRGVLEPWV